MAIVHRDLRRGEGEPSAAVPLEPIQSVCSRLSPEQYEQLRTLLESPVDYIPHPCFSRARTAKELFGAAVGSERAIKPWCNVADARKADSRSVSLLTPTLTGEQERTLFLRLNYARYRMDRILSKYAGKRLTKRAVAELLWWHAKMLASRREIIQANVALVLAMAKRTRLGGVDYAELISEGNMALLRSVDKFDCGRGFKFSTYACRAILKSFSRVAMRTSRYRGRFPVEFDPSLEKSDYIEQQRIEHEGDCMEELRGIIRTNSADLNDVEFKVIWARFALGSVEGLDERGPQTLEQVGLLIGVTKERVRQIQNRALAKLREKLQKDFLAA